LAAYPKYELSRIGRPLDALLIDVVAAVDSSVLVSALLFGFIVKAHQATTSRGYDRIPCWLDLSKLFVGDHYLAHVISPYLFQLVRKLDLFYRGTL
jgi:hypothetical protein